MEETNKSIEDFTFISGKKKQIKVFRRYITLNSDITKENFYSILIQASFLEVISFLNDCFLVSCGLLNFKRAYYQNYHYFNFNEMLVIVISKLIAEFALSTFIALLIDKFGRKDFILFSTLFMALCILIAGLTSTLNVFLFFQTFFHIFLITYSLVPLLADYISSECKLIACFISKIISTMVCIFLFFLIAIFPSIFHELNLKYMELHFLIIGLLILFFGLYSYYYSKSGNGYYKSNEENFTFCKNLKVICGNVWILTGFIYGVIKRIILIEYFNSCCMGFINILWL